MKMISCATHYPRHVVANLLSIKLWSQTQALSMTNHHITFNQIASMLHHDSITIINHLSSTIIACCCHPLVQLINSIICVFISVHKFIVFEFQLCLVCDEKIHANLQPMIFHHKTKILLNIVIIFRLRKMNYNMLCSLNKSKNRILITWHIFEMINNIGNNNYKSTNNMCIICDRLLSLNLVN